MPGQLFGYGRSDRSSKFIRGLESETPAGFRARRGFGQDPAPVTPDNALFASYKTPRVHHAARRRGSCVAARGARAAAIHAGDRGATAAEEGAISLAADLSYSSVVIEN